MLPTPPHCATSRPPGLIASWSRCEQRVVVVDPVKRRVREDDDRPARAARARRGPDTSTSRGRRAPPARARPSTARRRRRTRGRAGTQLGEPRGHPARAAAGVEHHLVAAQLEPLELLERPPELRIGDAVVGGRVPVARRPALTAPSSRVRGARARARRPRSRRPAASVSAMSSSPFSSRCLISASISKRAEPPGQRTSCARQVDLGLAGRARSPRTSSRGSSTGSSPIFVQLERKMSAKLGATIA